MPLMRLSRSALPLFSSVMNELKKAQIQREFFLRDPPVGSQPRA